MIAAAACWARSRSPAGVVSGAYVFPALAGALAPLRRRSGSATARAAVAATA